MSALPVLVVEHEAMCPPGWLGEWLSEVGCVLDVRRPYAGDALPDDLADHRSMVVLGGSMDADSDREFPWLTDVKQLVREAADTGVPVLGICLGHQVAAVALGGVVGRNPGGQQLGVLEVGWRDAARGDALFGTLSTSRAAVQWNNDIVLTPPPGAEILAIASTGEIQAARFAPSVWGVQWHPEVGVDIVSAWADSDRDAIHERGLDVDVYLAAIAGAHDVLRAGWRPLAEAFAGLDRQVARAW